MTGSKKNKKLIALSTLLLLSSFTIKGINAMESSINDGNSKDRDEDRYRLLSNNAASSPQTSSLGKRKEREEDHSGNLENSSHMMQQSEGAASRAPGDDDLGEVDRVVKRSREDTNPTRQEKLSSLQKKLNDTLEGVRDKFGEIFKEMIKIKDCKSLDFIAREIKGVIKFTDADIGDHLTNDFNEVISKILKKEEVVEATINRTSQRLEAKKPPHQLGKIINKHLILDIAGYAGNDTSLLLNASHRTRDLLVENFKAAKKLMPKLEQKLIADDLMGLMKVSLIENGFGRRWYSKYIQDPFVVSMIGFYSPDYGDGTSLINDEDMVSYFMTAMDDKNIGQIVAKVRDVFKSCITTNAIGKRSIQVAYEAIFFGRIVVAALGFYSGVGPISGRKDCADLDPVSYELDINRGDVDNFLNDLREKFGNTDEAGPKKAALTFFLNYALNYAKENNNFKQD